MNLLPEDISAYVEAHTNSESALLKALNRETHANYLYPQMLSGHLQGQLLSMISKMIRPKRILEIGTFTGYSAICLAEGLGKNGKLHTIEFNEELKEIAGRYFKKAGLSSKIVQHIGDALDVIPGLKEKFDLVFIDADKIFYAKYYDLVFNMLKKGSYLLADNALWNGKVLDTNQDKETKALDKFNKKITKDKRVDNVLLPIRDGIMLIRKK